MIQEADPKSQPTMITIFTPYFTAGWAMGRPSGSLPIIVLYLYFRTYIRQDFSSNIEGSFSKKPLITTILQKLELMPVFDYSNDSYLHSVKLMRIEIFEAGLLNTNQYFKRVNLISLQ